MVMMVMGCSWLLNFGPPAGSGDATAMAAERSFSGSWSANGDKEILAMGDAREAAIWHLSGHVNLAESIAGQSDYWARCIGLVDTATGGEFRCLWRGLNGQEIFLILQAEQLSREVQVHGELVGGSGAAAGISGTLEFQWSTLMIQRRGDKISVGGYARELSGSYQLP